MPKVLSDANMLQLLDSRYGTKPLVAFYLKKAKDAAGRAKVALMQENPYTLGAEAQTMIENIEMLSKILGNDDAILTEGDTSKNK